MKNDRFEKKKNCRRFKIKNAFRIILDINANCRKQQHDEFARQKLMNDVEITNSKNMKRALSRNLMNKFRFVNKSLSNFKNVNALIVVNTMIDFDFL